MEAIYTELVMDGHTSTMLDKYVNLPKEQKERGDELRKWRMEQAKKKKRRDEEELKECMENLKLEISKQHKERTDELEQSLRNVISDFETKMSAMSVSIEQIARFYTLFSEKFESFQRSVEILISFEDGLNSRINDLMPSLQENLSENEQNKSQDEQWDDEDSSDESN
jgi:hypothetical protein